MTSLLAEPLALRGSQQPRVSCHPLYVSSAGQDAVDLASLAGLYLDEWQQFVLCHALGERPDGKWAAFEVGVNVPRQNGKGGILEARELAGLFLLKEDLIIHSAHEFATAMEAFERMVFLIENTPDLAKRLRGGTKGIHRSHGSEGFTLRGGQRLRYKTRTGGGGRGFTCDCLVIDEAFNMPKAKLASILPTLSAVPNPQVWYTSSAVDQLDHEHGVVFAQVRERGIEGTDPRLAYFEWSADLQLDKLTAADAADPLHWAQANPALGIRISAEFIDWERRGPLGRRKFAVERLNLGDYPRTDEEAERPISMDAWRALTDSDSVITSRWALAIDTAPDRSMSSIAAAGFRSDGVPHVGVVKRDRGTSWVLRDLPALLQRVKPAVLALDGIGPVGSLLPDIEKLTENTSTKVVPVTSREYGQACGFFFDRVTDSGLLRHAGDPELDDALDSATKKPLGDAWKWDRKASGADITALVAATLALWGSLSQPEKPKPRFISLADALRAAEETTDGE